MIIKGDNIMDEGEARSESAMTIGWREWLALPELGIAAIKAKIDTGARSSSLHTHFIEHINGSHTERVRFSVRPLRKREDVEIFCEADIVDYRRVKDSGGHSEMRCFISTSVSMGGCSWPIEISLANREEMRFRMLLGRTALKSGFVVDPGKSYLTGRRLAKYYRNK
jgi:hypothetical protein